MAAAKPLHALLLTLGCGLGLLIIDPPAWGIKVFNVIGLILKAITIWCVVWYLLKVTDQVTEHLSYKASQTEGTLDDMMIPIVRGVSKFIIVAIGVLLVVQNMGYSISSLIAGLGLGGAAIALAAKDTIANLFGSLVVFLDHPFDLGDWVSFNGVEGTVEEIRVRTTLIRAFDGSVVMVPNASLTNDNINNLERRKLRRMDANFGVYYSTKADQVEQIVADLKQYVADHQDIFGPKCFIGFSGFGDSSLDIFVLVYTYKTGLADFCVVRQDFLLEIMRIVERNGTGFAFPTRTLEIAPNSAPLPIHSPLPMVPETIIESKK
jgi:MscS family membrane protein